MPKFTCGVSEREEKGGRGFSRLLTARTRSQKTWILILAQLLPGQETVSHQPTNVRSRFCSDGEWGKSVSSACSKGKCIVEKLYKHKVPELLN